MVCIAAFIILCILSVFVAVLSIFRRDLGKKYWKLFKKSWGCVGKKVTLQKCETNFKDDIKNSLLKKVVIKKPKLVKPISVAIEVLSVLIVAITVWSLIIALKSGLALWTFGTCNVTTPSACTLGAEVCSIDQSEPENLTEAFVLWFTEWGQIFEAIPDRLKTWNASDYISENKSIYGSFESDKPLALDILDPGCVICLQSFKNKLSSGFTDSHAMVLLPYPIQEPNGNYKFKNSGIITQYLLANELFVSRRSSEDHRVNSWQILQKIFTEYDEDYVIYQNVFNERLDEDAAEDLLFDWLIDFGYSCQEASEISELAHSDEIKQKILDNKELVDHKLHAKGIPTMIYDGKKYTGLYKND